MRRYAMEAGFLARLLADRREIFAMARSLGSAAEMRSARDDLMASITINRTPTAEKPLSLDVRNGVAHIPVTGELTSSADPCGALTGDAETEYGYIRAALAEAEASPEVLEIALDVNSPGGYMDGLDMTAQAIAGCTKPVIAYVDGMACSAAYWLASQADQVIALSPAAIIGSIGLATEEYNDDEANARDGVAHRVYTSTDAPDKRPDTSTPEGRAKVVSELDALHAVFVRRVAEGRHVSPETVNADFGRGGVLTAEAAMAAGMIDDVIGSHLYRPQSSPAGVASSAAATSTAISPKEVHMDLAQLKAEHPEAYAAAKAEGIAEGKAAGIQAERERREKLLGLAVNAEALKAVNAAIASGASFEAASPTIVTAALKGTGGDNPPAVGTKPPEGGAGASEETEAKALASGIAAGFRARKEGK